MAEDKKPATERQVSDFDKKLEAKANSSYKNIPEEKCWYDQCNCESIPVGDCEALYDENNKGVGRYACMAEDQKCYNPTFFSHFMKKLTCQLDHIIQNICALWDLMQCIVQYLRGMGDVGTVQVNYARNSATSSATFYKPIGTEYDIELWMDSTTGKDNQDDDGKRKETDRKYSAYIRWCADGTSLNPAQDNTMEFVVYHSGESYSEEMKKTRGVHWQMTGISDGAMEMSDRIVLPAGTHIKVHVAPANSSAGIFRLHQFKVEYTPLIDGGDLPSCLQAPEKKKDDPCANCPKSEPEQGQPPK